MSKRKNRRKRRSAKTPTPAAAATSSPRLSPRGVLLWLALVGLVAVLLCALESVKEALRGGA